MGPRSTSSEIQQMIAEAGGAIFKTPVIENKSLEEMLEHLGLKRVEGLESKFEDTEKGLMLIIRAPDVNSAFEVFSKIYNDNKTEIHYPKPLPPI
ncbi:MAG: hypothetical protein COU82_01205 [Candidatus Portnoybacteria bacterium CG10_big_fil_rev_8_21_14_0_10_38_18]|uniref:Uncharacterized protein n=1 Tax=Candidatus Portnoybacteria bacterium CG10_big_fil_rev_8_21_14_0_10_38_18 TaxID=1974813 RepID=A0A2M8KCH3_9BACT|nr:MAG: hypothetical protein COU82_01205 [Candidatus Portnoybacteria bacterium CG10_big_fil_rev_8_21_14_0_10_38_18]